MGLLGGSGLRGGILSARRNGSGEWRNRSSPSHGRRPGLLRLLNKLEVIDLGASNLI